jgi:hypothetical protein
MSKIIKVEVLIATPPTSRCQETIGVLEELVRRHPDELRLVVFRRGIDFVPDEMRLEAPEGGEAYTPKPASLQMRVIAQKGSAVPSTVVDGVLFSSFAVPNPVELEARVQEVLLGAGAK